MPPIGRSAEGLTNGQWWTSHGSKVHSVLIGCGSKRWVKRRHNSNWPNCLFSRSLFCVATFDFINFLIYLVSRLNLCAFLLIISLFMFKIMTYLVKPDLIAPGLIKIVYYLYDDKHNFILTNKSVRLRI